MEVTCLQIKNPLFDEVEQTMPDAMHTIAVQMKHLVRCIAWKELEDDVGVRMQEKGLCRFKELGAGVKAMEKALPTSPFGLTKKEIEEADRRATEIVTPAGDSFIPGPIFSHISKLNSHQWKEVHITSYASMAKKPFQSIACMRVVKSINQTFKNPFENCFLFKQRSHQA